MEHECLLGLPLFLDNDRHIQYKITSSRTAKRTTTFRRIAITDTFVDKFFHKEGNFPKWGQKPGFKSFLSLYFVGIGVPNSVLFSFQNLSFLEISQNGKLLTGFYHFCSFACTKPDTLILQEINWAYMQQFSDQITIQSDIILISSFSLLPLLVVSYLACLI